jgi:hypothetical protein
MRNWGVTKEPVLERIRPIDLWTRDDIENPVLGEVAHGKDRWPRERKLHGKGGQAFESARSIAQVD